jgi:hypothetical protein
MDRKQYNKEYREKRINQGLCVGCGFPNNGKNLCQECLDKATAKRKENILKRLCGCGKPRRDGYQSCEICSNKYNKNEYNKNKRLISLQRKSKRNKNKEKGLCVFCTKPALPDKTTCEYHLQKRTNFRKHCREKGICPQCGELKSNPKNTYCDEHQSHWKIRKHAEGLRIKKEVINYYNELSQCVCCGESNLVFLTIDHMDNNGAEHRKKINRFGEGFYRWLISNNFPNGYQVLCFNCNCGRKINGGICPHKIF